MRFPAIGTADPDLDLNGPIGDVDGGVAGTGSSASGSGAKTLTPGAVADIARQTFFTLQTGAFDQLASNLLRGERAISNDISLME